MAVQSACVLSVCLLCVAIQAYDTGSSAFIQQPTCSSSSAGACGNPPSDVTSLIQSGVVVNEAASRTAAGQEEPDTSVKSVTPAPGVTTTAGASASGDDYGHKFKGLVDFYADAEEQSRLAWQKQELSGCVFGESGVTGPDGNTCLSEYSAGNPFSTDEAETANFVYTWDEHVKLPIDQRLEQERTGDGLIGGVDLLFMEDLVSVKDVNGRDLAVGCLPMRAPHAWSSLQKVHFPLSVTLTAEDPVVGAKNQKIDLGGAFEEQLTKAKAIYATAKSDLAALKTKAGSMTKDKLKALEADIASQLKKMEGEYKANIKKIEGEVRAKTDVIDSKAKAEGKQVMGKLDKSDAIFNHKEWSKADDLRDEISRLAGQKKASIQKQMETDIMNVKAELEEKLADLRKGSLDGQLKAAASKVASTWFTTMALPLIKKFFLPKIESEVNFTKFMTEAKGGIAAVDSAANVVQKAATAIQNVSNQSVMDEYVKGKVAAIVHGIVTNDLVPLYQKVWTKIRALKAIITAPLVQLLGAIPFVGGVLAWILTWVMDEACEYLKNTVNGVISKALKVVEAGMVDSIYKPIAKWVEKEIAAHGAEIKKIAADVDKVVAEMKTEAHTALTALQTQLTPAASTTPDISAGDFKKEISAFAWHANDDAKQEAEERVAETNSVSLGGAFAGGAPAQDAKAGKPGKPSGK